MNRKKSSFEVIFRHLRTGPPSLTAVQEFFYNAEALTQFVALVREYLPDKESVILSEAGAVARINKFVKFFTPKYFPLSDVYWESDEGYEQFVHSIPLDLEGFTEEDYDEFEDRFSPEMIVELALISYPFNYDEGAEDERGISHRVPIIEQAAKLTGEIAFEIPAVGWTPEELHAKCDKTPYEGLAASADWIHSVTGCGILDCNYDGYEGDMWERDTVESITEQYPVKLALQKKMTEFETWLHEDLRNHFTELVNFLNNKKKVAKEQLKLGLKEDEPIQTKNY